ncbi:sensor histidine kinase [Bacillus benzoevorans]|uniref:histidine kinase n=1 Tax=Bacillus benzoevorans TaxID=1456 RepID=A0A7X0HNX2_9BACI|nr:sensor histidine kinase [Bacillus benzoevorans]MBB6444174.1 two-component system sensor histidine kinase DesK [Bacillus benzoevorans]
MKKKFPFLYSSSGVSPYIWTLFSILPFYFIYQWSTTTEVIVGILLTLFFFITYRMAFISKNWLKYVLTAFLIITSIAMISYLGYVYFAFFVAYLIGGISNRIAFFTFYIIHLIFSTVAINVNFVMQDPLFLKQFPFIIIIWISIILLPFNIYNRKKREQLEEQLAFANKRISDLIVQEERQRIARDLHDTLGQKLSLIGLKSDLARKLLDKNPEQARSELKDIQHTARTALNEVRKMVSHMRGHRLKDEIIEVKELLTAAQIEMVVEQDTPLTNVSLFLENILSMCLKETITNIVKHSQASKCVISIRQSNDEITIMIHDNGIGFARSDIFDKGNGLIGIKERLEFVNGNLEILTEAGAKVVIKVPNVVKQALEKEGKTR